MKKRHASSRIMSLPPAQRDALVKWLLDDNLTYPQAREKLAKEFNFQTGTTALCEFFQSHCQPIILQRARTRSEQPPVASTPALLEIIVMLDQPNIVRLKIVPGAGVRVEGCKA